MTLGAAAPTIRPVRPQDVPAVVAMVHELAEYERAADRCHLTAGQLEAALFGPAPALFGHVAVDTTGQPVGFALWFLTFSTWEGTHGIHLEDLYVRPAARGTGAGRLLLAALAARCVEHGYRRLEWMMLDWNPAAGFYRAIDASTIDDWVPYRLEGAALQRLAAGSTAGGAPAGPTG
ncbi:GNAT family N-acetyltransferase [Micromonospora sp. NPDC050187]|uniref:GNAT family N-acetyltransferase n=1 Tax=Micromonospora sp. NPDC050187 TaxID=3364277 RepID=UPI0037943D4C